MGWEGGKTFGLRDGMGVVLVGTGQDGSISSWDGTGSRNASGTRSGAYCSRENSRESGRECGRESGQDTGT